MDLGGNEPATKADTLIVFLTHGLSWCRWTTDGRLRSMSGTIVDSFPNANAAFDPVRGTRTLLVSTAMGMSESER